MHDLKEHILAWAQAEEPVRAVAITGSLGREDGTADQWSDLDVQIIARDSARYTRSDDWLRVIGEVWVQLPPGPDDDFRLVWFAGGRKADFHFLPLEYVTRQVASGDLSDEYQRGYSVVLDKDGLYDDLPPSPRRFPAPNSPTQAQFSNTIDEFWFEAIHVAQFLRRRELWVVRFRDWTMKCDLLQMLEWRAQRQSGGARNTWVIGKRIEDWVDPAHRDLLHHIWAGWNVEESWQALFAMMEGFCRVSSETAPLFRFAYDDGTYVEIAGYIRALYTQQSSSGV